MPQSHKKGKYKRYRIRSPTQFLPRSFRTQDIGRAGHSKRIAGILKNNGIWATQSMLVLKSDPTTKKMRKAIARLRKYASL